jgi:hypothetical protein
VKPSFPRSAAASSTPNSKNLEFVFVSFCIQTLQVVTCNINIFSDHLITYRYMAKHAKC